MNANTLPLPQTHGRDRVQHMFMYVAMLLLWAIMCIWAAIDMHSLRKKEIEYATDNAMLTTSVLREYILTTVNEIDGYFLDQLEIHKEELISGKNLGEVTRSLNRHMRQFPEVRAFFISNAEGDILASTNPLSINTAHHTYFQQLRDNPGTGLLVGNQHTTTKKCAIVFGRRIESPEGKFKGAITAEIPCNFFEKFVSTIHRSPYTTLSLLNND
ncbi:MAG: hypothetical protein FWD51_01830, partial [Betaproteobacteria bacterium]|nr:hypothetical protein [Betaproteobacteria bacterium]